MSVAAPPTPGELGAVLEELLHPGVIAGLVAPLLERRVDLDTLAAASYEHPNGFDKLVLRVLDDGRKVVLHAWWPDGAGAPLGDGNFHDHRWHFATVVLGGTYRFVEYEEQPLAGAGQLVVKHRYASPAGDDGYRLTSLGPSRLRAVRRGRLTPDDGVYLLDCEAIHRIELDGREPTVTLFVQGTPVRDATRVFAARTLARDEQIAVTRFAPKEYVTRLRRALSCVALPG